MDELNFSWDKNKDQINIQKHGISFEEAKTTFYDENAILFDDPDHSEDEDRFLILGVTKKERLCIVSHCYRDDGDVIRIISARKATKAETGIYNEYSEGEE